MPLRALMPAGKYKPQAGHKHEQNAGQDQTEHGLSQDDARNQIEIEGDAEHQRHKRRQQQPAAEDQKVLAHLSRPRLPVVRSRRNYQCAGDRKKSQGEQVDAREWWDGHWIEDRILAKLREFGAEPAAGGAAASASPSP